MSKLVDFIHVGDYKTGTSWLQQRVFPYHPEIQYLGDHFKDKSQKKVLRELVDIRDLDFDAQCLSETFRQNFARERGKIVGISREALSQSDYISGENAKRNALRIKEIFGNVKIIYVIREQISMLGAIYSQYLKTGGTRKFNDWFLDPIECAGIIERLKYDKNIKMYQSIFGEENVKVLLYEELKSDNSLFLKKLFKFLECKDIHFQPPENKVVVNASLKSHGAMFSKYLQPLFRNSYHNYRSSFLNLDKIIYTLMSKKEIRRRDILSMESVIPSYGDLDRRNRVLYSINMGGMGRIRRLSESIRTGNKINVPEEVKEQILPLFLESNKKLKNIYDLDIDQYGWALDL